MGGQAGGYDTQAMLKSPTPPPLLGEQGRIKRRQLFDELCVQLPTLDSHIRNRAQHLYDSLGLLASPDDLAVCAEALCCPLFASCAA